MSRGEEPGDLFFYGLLLPQMVGWIAMSLAAAAYLLWTHGDNALAVMYLSQVLGVSGGVTVLFSFWWYDV